MAELMPQNILEAVTIKRSSHVTMKSVLAYVRDLREFEFDDWDAWDRLCGRGNTGAF